MVAFGALRWTCAILGEYSDSGTKHLVGLKAFTMVDEEIPAGEPGDRVLEDGTSRSPWPGVECSCFSFGIDGVVAS